jgi:hypothetical protein
MNAERLHAIALDALSDIRDTDQIKLLSELSSLANELEGLDKPQSTINAFEGVRLDLVRRLVEAKSNSFSPGWQRALRQMGVEELLGVNLMRQVENLINRNPGSYSSVVAGLSSIRNKLKARTSTLQNLVTAFEALGIDADELNPGECGDRRRTLGAVERMRRQTQRYRRGVRQHDGPCQPRK